MPRRQSAFKIEERILRGIERRQGVVTERDRIAAAAEVNVLIDNKTFEEARKKAREEAAAETLKLIEEGQAVRVGSSTVLKGKEGPVPPWGSKERSPVEERKITITAASSSATKQLWKNR